MTIFFLLFFFSMNFASGTILLKKKLLSVSVRITAQDLTSEYISAGAEFQDILWTVLKFSPSLFNFNLVICIILLS